MNDWRVRELSEAEASFDLKTEVERMAEAVKASYGPNWKPRPKTTEQAPSTKALLEAQQKRPRELDEEHWNRPMLPPEKVYANPEAIEKFKTTGDPVALKEAVGERTIAPEEVVIEERRRRRPKNQLGQSMESGASQETRDRAAHHFLVTPGVPADKLTEDQAERITGIEPIKSDPPPPLELKKKKTIREVGMSIMDKINFWRRNG